MWSRLGNRPGSVRLAVEAIGIALTFSVVLGLSAAVGSLIPLIRLHLTKSSARLDWQPFQYRACAVSV